MKAGGVSLHRLALPVILLAAAIGVASFFVSEWIVPYANTRAETIRLVEVPRKENMPTFKQNQIWYRGKDGVYNFRFYEPRTNTLRGITIYYLTPDFGLWKRIDGEKAEWKNGQWVFTKLLISRFDQGGFPSLEWVPRRVVPLPEKPEDFQIVQKDTEQMGFFELRDYVRRLRAEGFDATRYETDMYGKVAFSLVTVLLVLIGISFSLREERGGGVSRSVGAAIVIGFSYWLVHAFSLSLGRAGTLPPILAAGMADILFLAAAAFMYSRIRT
jgi:lipopolysaccharide export system permease protein